MPTTYAHDSFGRKVLKQLPGELQTLIRGHIELYRIGLHGPDILFYYGLKKNYVNQTGVRLHGEIAYDFFEKGIRMAREEQDEALLVYLLGFACHFMLDSTCHPYVYHIAKEVGHTLIEKEMDRQLMEKDGLDPLTYFPAVGIVPSEENARVIQKMFPDISVEIIRKALCGMRRLTGLMIYGDGVRHKVILSGLALTGRRDTLGDHFMTKDPAPHLDKDLDVLEELYRRAITETPVQLEILAGAYYEGREIPGRFRRNYKYI